jgi:hypothetical protein
MFVLYRALLIGEVFATVVPEVCSALDENIFGPVRVCGVIVKEEPC